ncbi:hypothetical protein Sgleb_75930 [Streptomyces glebosus]|uniref:Uncharacterized protein n=1 Tax=Streptomyces glebosus TaxID=249580 RepID=A0A640SM58_9ACTN|nr:hypothetical protein Sgleb_00010 [Streptomyces glebosus]GFE19546.1 hypothetical protein Sgleb_75930 [Streptomyces glebosus]GHG91441.1 hypothetical protein GCM10010513_74910 [Streptomyces glebosus]
MAKVTFTQVNGHVVQGWLEKLSKDKTCAQVIVKWYKGGKLRDTDLSEKVCRKGQKKYFSMRAGDKHHFNASDLWVGYKLS